MQSTGQLTGSAADAIELCGMDYEPLDTASGSVNQFSELLKGLSGIVWDFYMERSRPYLDILHRSGRPYLLLTQEKQLQCDVIREDKAAEGRLLTEYALKNGHRHILFLCRTEPEAQLLEGTTYSNAMRILFNIPPDQLMERFVRGDVSRTTRYRAIICCITAICMISSGSRNSKNSP